VTAPAQRWDFGTAREVVRVSLPLMFGMVGNLIMMLVDRISLARYSEETLNASGPAVFTAIAIVTFFTGTAAIARSYVAQAFGRGSKIEAAEEGGTAIVIGVLLAALLLALGPAIAYIPHLSNRPADVADLESVYLVWAVRYGAVMVLNVALASYFNGIGRTRVPFAVGIAGQVVDVLSTIGLVFGIFGLPEWGMAGSAIGTLAGTLVMTAGYLLFLPRAVLAGFVQVLRSGRDLLGRLRLRLLRGVGTGGSAGLDELGQTAFVWLAGLIGPVALAANNVAVSVNFLGIIPLIGLGIGCSILSAQAIGEGRHPAVTHIVRVTLAVSSGYILVMSFLQIVFPGVLLAPFGLDNVDAEAAAAAVATSRVLWTYSVTFMFSMVGASVLESFGLTKFSFVSRLIVMWGLSIPLMYVVSRTIDDQPVALVVQWLVGSVFEGALGALFFWRMRKAIRIRENALMEAPDQPLTIEPDEAGIIERYPARAINCFTGCLAELSARNGRPIEEARILEHGDGYLLRSGHDEWGYPEYTFAVEEAGLRGVRALGIEARSVAIDTDRWADQLAELTANHGGAVVWTNSSPLPYAEVYADSPAYLHAVLVTGVSADRSLIRLYDALVVDRERWGCEVWVAAKSFGPAITETVRTETYDHMGHFHVLVPGGTETTVPATAEALVAQAGQLFADPGYHEAISSYRQACIEAFDRSPEEARRAARRLFDHINVLYVVPDLMLLHRSLEECDGGDRAAELCVTATDHWRALAVLALKYEATASPAVRERLAARFTVVDAAVTAMWKAILELPGLPATPNSGDERGVRR